MYPLSSSGKSDGPALTRASLLERIPSTPLRKLSSAQQLVDQSVGSFIHETIDGKFLPAMIAGGIAYRAARVGVMGLGAGSGVFSVGAGLASEVSVFELAYRGLSSAHVGSPVQANLWSWNGSGGLKQGLLHSFIAFGSIKGAARLGASENFLLQHLMQDSAMVLSHQALGAMGVTPPPTETLAEQFLHAEASNLKVRAGMALAQGFAPRLHSLERGLVLSLPRVGDPAAPSAKATLGWNPLLEPSLATKGNSLPELSSVWRMGGSTSSGKMRAAQAAKAEDWDVKTPATTVTTEKANWEFALATRQSNEKILGADLNEIRSKAVHYSVGRPSMGTGFTGMALGHGQMPIHAAVDPQTGQIIGVGKIQSRPEDILETTAEVIFVVQILPKNFNGDYEKLGDSKPHVSKIHFFQPERMSSEAKETLLELKGVPFRLLSDLARTSGAFLSNEKIIRGDLEEVRSAGVYYVVERESLGVNAGRGKFAINAVVDPEMGDIMAVGNPQHIPPLISEGKVGVSFLVQAVPDHFRGNFEELGKFKPRVVEVYFHNPDLMTDRAQQSLLETVGLPFRALKSSYRPAAFVKKEAPKAAPFPLNPRDKSLLEMASGQKLGDSLDFSQWEKMDFSMDPSRFPKTHPQQLGNLSEDLIALQVRITRHFREAKKK